MHCRHENTKRIPRVFKNGTRHIELRCNDCGNYVKFEPNEKSDLELQNWIMPLGKYKGKTLTEIYSLDKSYLEWAVENMEGNRVRTIKQYLGKINGKNNFL